MILQAILCFIPNVHSINPEIEDELIRKIFGTESNGKKDMNLLKVKLNYFIINFSLAPFKIVKL